MSQEVLDVLQSEGFLDDAEVHIVEVPDKDSFYEGQTFVKEYPPEAAAWCNDDPEGRYTIVEASTTEDGITIYKIVDITKNRTEEELWTDLRNTRDALLQQTDKYMTIDYPISAELQNEYKEYRQALRDITSKEGAPWDGGGKETPWPTLPSNNE